MILRTRTERVLYHALELKCDSENAWMPLEIAVQFAEQGTPKHIRSFLSTACVHNEEVVWISQPGGKDDL